MSYSRTFSIAVLLSSALLLSACGGRGENNSPSTPACDEGTKECACYGNSTCNEGLTCSASLCIDPTSCEDGSQGCACYGNGTCDASLECVGNICQPSMQYNDMGTQDTGSPPIMDLAGEAFDITPAGGQVMFEDVTLIIPDGAVSSSTEIRIVKTDAKPAGYELYSPVYRFEPEGLQFDKPIEVRIRFEGNANLATKFWSWPDATGYQRRGGTVFDNQVTTFTEHFSLGFVANGVDFTSQPDTSCVYTDVLAGRPDEQFGAIPEAPSAVGVLLRVTDCQGRPISGLDSQAGDFFLLEDQESLSAESSGFTVLEHETAVQGFVTLALDMSASTKPFEADVIAGAKAFVTKIREERGLPIHIGILPFAGDQDPYLWQKHTLDVDVLHERLDALATEYQPFDASSTNLNGGLQRAQEEATSEASAFQSRNNGGAFAVGLTVLFTDGRDTAGYQGEVPAGSVLAIGLETEDYRRAELLDLIGGDEYAYNLIETTEPSQLTREFALVANQLAAQIDGATYLVGYCSPSRSGQHSVTVGVTSGEGNPRSSFDSYPFAADGFGPGCSLEFFENACENKECGGLGCGACDERVATCGGTVCVNNCLEENLCGGETFTNDQGYEQTCSFGPEVTTCEDQCIDTSSDSEHCGACGNLCPITEVCIDSRCQCPLGWDICEDACTDTSSDKRHCGQCGASCQPGEMCSNGMCHDNLTVQITRRCARKSDGTVRCWGSGLHVLPPDTFRSLSTGKEGTRQEHSCAIKTDGTLKCWGESTVIPPTGKYTQVVAGTYYWCAIRDDQKIVCWGNLPEGIQPTPEGSFKRLWISPVQSSLDPLAYICASRLDDSLVCWGTNNWSWEAPPQGVVDRVIFDLKSAKQACALMANGTAKCWGENNINTPIDSPVGIMLSDVFYIGSRFACGIEKSTDRYICWGDPISLDAIQNNIIAGSYRRIVGSPERGCGLTTQRKIQCWGGILGEDEITLPGEFSHLNSNLCALNKNNEVLCLRNTDIVLHPIKNGVRELSENSLCALDKAGKIVCWRQNGGMSHIGDGFLDFWTTNSSGCGVTNNGALKCYGLVAWDAFVELPSGNFKEVFGERRAGCGLRQDGSVSCWNQTNFNVFTSPPTNLKFRHIYGTYNGGCGIQTNGEIYCWDHSHELPAGAFESIAYNVGKSCGLRSDGTVSCWIGQVMNPGPSPPNERFKSLTMCSHGGAGILRDGTAITWGEIPSLYSETEFSFVNCYGPYAINKSNKIIDLFNYPNFVGSYIKLSGGLTMCGIDSSNNIRCPVDDSAGIGLGIPSGSYSQIDITSHFACGLRNDGSITCWGSGNNQQLSPPSGSFKQISVSGIHACALRHDGSVDCWDGIPPDETERFTQISAGDNGYNIFCGIKDDSTIGCWATSRSSTATSTPPSGTFTYVDVGKNTACGIRSDGSIECWTLGIDVIRSREFLANNIAPSGIFTKVKVKASETDGRDSYCALRDDQALVCWGSASREFVESGPFIDFEMASNRVCGVKTDQSVSCWQFGPYMPPRGW